MNKKQDVVFGSVIILTPIVLAIWSLFVNFYLIDLLYLIAILILAVNYIKIYRENR